MCPILCNFLDRFIKKLIISRGLSYKFNKELPLAYYVLAEVYSDKARKEPKKVFVFGPFVNKAKHPSILLASHWQERLQSRAEERRVAHLLVSWVKNTHRDYAKSKDGHFVFAGRIRTKAAIKLLFPHESEPHGFEHGGEGGF